MYFCVHLGEDLHPEPDYDRVLLRIMHLFEEGEDPELSKPVAINLKVINYSFPSLKDSITIFVKGLFSVWTACSAGHRGSQKAGGAFSYRNLGHQPSAEVEVEDGG